MTATTDRPRDDAVARWALALSAFLAMSNPAYLDDKRC